MTAPNHGVAANVEHKQVALAQDLESWLAIRRLSSSAPRCGEQMCRGSQHHTVDVWLIESLIF